jgi:hypothetical protein
MFLERAESRLHDARFQRCLVMDLLTSTLPLFCAIALTRRTGFHWHDCIS